MKLRSGTTMYYSWEPPLIITEKLYNKLSEFNDTFRDNPRFAKNLLRCINNEDSDLKVRYLTKDLIEKEYKYNPPYFNFSYYIVTFNLISLLHGSYQDNDISNPYIDIQPVFYDFIQSKITDYIENNYDKNVALIGDDIE